MMPFHGIFMAMLIFMAHERVSFHGYATNEKPMILFHGQVMEISQIEFQ